MSISPDSLESFRALLLGFAFAGLAASTYEMLTARRLGLQALRTGDAAAVLSAPILVFTAPYIVIRGIVGARRRRWPFHVVLGATVFAGLWSLLCGRFVLDAASRLLGA